MAKTGATIRPTYEIQLVHRERGWWFALTIVNNGSEWHSPLVSLRASDYAEASAEAEAQVRLLLTYFEGRGDG